MPANEIRNRSVSRSLCAELSAEKQSDTSFARFGGNPLFQNKIAALYLLCLKNPACKTEVAFYRQAAKVKKKTGRKIVVDWSVP